MSETRTITNTKENVVPCPEAFEQEQGEEVEQSVASGKRRQRNEELMEIIRDPSSTPYQVESAKNAIIQENEAFIGFVIRKNYSAIPSLYEDLMQAGRIGILLGLEKYDPNRATFGTYMMPFIRHEISQALAQNVGITSHTLANITRVNRATQELTSITGRTNPTSRDIAVFADTRVSVVDSAQTAKKAINSLSLDAPLDDDNDSWTILSSMPSAIGNPVEESEENEKRQLLLDAIKRLPKVIQQKVVYFSFGLDGNGSRSNIEVSEIVGLDPTAVKKHLNIARRRLAADKKLREAFSGYVKDNVAEEIPIVDYDYIEKEAKAING